jgi:hypothetical protein
MTITTFERRVTPLAKVEREDTHNGNSIEYEDFPTDLDVLGPLLHYFKSTGKKWAWDTWLMAVF